MKTAKSTEKKVSSEKESLVLAQFGCGYWGPNLLRNFSSLPNCTVKYVVDQSAERRDFVRRNFPGTSGVDSCEAVLNDPDVQAVIIATPAETHFGLAKKVLARANMSSLKNRWQRKYRKSTSWLRPLPKKNSLSWRATPSFTIPLFAT